MTTQTIELVPKEVYVKQNGNTNRLEAVHAGILITWIRPNESNHIITGEIKEFRLQGGRKYSGFKIEAPKKAADYQNKQLCKNLIRNQLLKTKAVGRSVIKAELLVADTPTLLHRVFARILGVGIDALGVTNPFASTILDLGENEINKAVKNKQITSLGEGYYWFDADQVVEEIRFELKTVKALTAVMGTDEHGIPIIDPDEQAVELIAANAHNGHLLLTVNQITI